MTNPDTTLLARSKKNKKKILVITAISAVLLLVIIVVVLLVVQPSNQGKSNQGKSKLTVFTRTGFEPSAVRVYTRVASGGRAIPFPVVMCPTGLTRHDKVWELVATLEFSESGAEQHGNQPESRVLVGTLSVPGDLPVVALVCLGRHGAGAGPVALGVTGAHTDENNPASGYLSGPDDRTVDMWESRCLLEGAFATVSVALAVAPTNGTSPNFRAYSVEQSAADVSEPPRLRLRSEENVPGLEAARFGSGLLMVQLHGRVLAETAPGSWAPLQPAGEFGALSVSPTWFPAAPDPKTVFFLDALGFSSFAPGETVAERRVLHTAADSAVTSVSSSPSGELLLTIAGSSGVHVLNPSGALVELEQGPAVPAGSLLLYAGRAGYFIREGKPEGRSWLWSGPGSEHLREQEREAQQDRTPFPSSHPPSGTVWDGRWLYVTACDPGEEVLRRLDVSQGVSLDGIQHLELVDPDYLQRDDVGGWPFPADPKREAVFQITGSSLHRSDGPTASLALPKGSERSGIVLTAFAQAPGSALLAQGPAGGLRLVWPGFAPQFPPIPFFRNDTGTHHRLISCVARSAFQLLRSSSLGGKLFCYFLADVTFDQGPGTQLQQSQRALVFWCQEKPGEVGYQHFVLEWTNLSKKNQGWADFAVCRLGQYGNFADGTAIAREENIVLLSDTGELWYARPGFSKYIRKFEGNTLSCSSVVSCHVADSEPDQKLDAWLYFLEKGTGHLFRTSAVLSDDDDFREPTCSFRREPARVEGTAVYSGMFVLRSGLYTTAATSQILERVQAGSPGTEDQSNLMGTGPFETGEPSAFFSPGLVVGILPNT